MSLLFPTSTTSMFSLVAKFLASYSHLPTDSKEESELTS